jgi:predicted amidophosphoribosyltransferase
MGFLDDLFEGGHRRGQGHGRGHDDDDHEHGHDDRWGPNNQGPGPFNRVTGATTLCGGCKAPVAMLPGFRFCPYCGGGLNVSPTCGNCGAQAVPGAAFCPSCGTKV